MRRHHDHHHPRFGRTSTAPTAGAMTGPMAPRIPPRAGPSAVGVGGEVAADEAPTTPTAAGPTPRASTRTGSDPKASGAAARGASAPADSDPAGSVPAGSVPAGSVPAGATPKGSAHRRGGPGRRGGGPDRRGRGPHRAPRAGRAHRGAPAPRRGADARLPADADHHRARPEAAGARAPAPSTPPSPSWRTRVSSPRRRAADASSRASPKPDGPMSRRTPRPGPIHSRRPRIRWTRGEVIDLRELGHGLMGALREVARTGTDSQVREAATLLEEARRCLYTILAGPSAASQSTQTDPPAGPEAGPDAAEGGAAGDPGTARGASADESPSAQS